MPQFQFNMMDVNEAGADFTNSWGVGPNFLSKYQKWLAKHYGTAPDGTPRTAQQQFTAHAQGFVNSIKDAVNRDYLSDQVRVVEEAHADTDIEE